MALVNELVGLEDAVVDGKDVVVVEMPESVGRDANGRVSGLPDLSAVAGHPLVAELQLVSPRSPSPKSPLYPPLNSLGPKVAFSKRQDRPANSSSAAYYFQVNSITTGGFWVVFLPSAIALFIGLVGVSWLLQINVPTKL